MKKRLMRNLMACAVIGLSTVCFFLPDASAAATATLKVMNPLGEITPPPVFAPSARIPDPASKRIAIYWNGKAGGDNFWNIIEELLIEKLPNAHVLRYEGPFDLGDDRAAKIASESDAFFYGVGD